VLASDEAWLVSLIGVVLIVLSLLAAHAREAVARIEPSADFIAGAMLVGVLFLTAGLIAGGAWAQRAWGEFWSWDPKQTWTLITLMVYLVPLVGRSAGWLKPFGIAAASVGCFMSVLTSWYGLNVVQRVGRHEYGFTEGGHPEIATAGALVLLAVVGAAAWRRSRAN
jgi:MYXO-CTERM domain-containing protein